jgi:hypothetical protein
MACRAGQATFTDFYAFYDSPQGGLDLKNERAGLRAVLYWIVGYVTIFYALITIVVVRRVCFGSSRFGAKSHLVGVLAKGDLRLKNEVSKMTLLSRFLHKGSFMCHTFAAKDGCKSEKR